MADYSYIGSGKIYLREIGGTGSLIEIGNCSALSLGTSEEERTMRDYTQPGGGTYNSISRISEVTISLTANELSPENLARALYGSTSASAAATVTDESITAAVPGGLNLLSKLATSVTSVTEGATPLTAGVDYEVVAGGIKILEGGALAGGETILVTYQAAGQDVVEALTTSAAEYEMVFAGLNEARSGKQTRVIAHRVKLGAAGNIGLLSDDYAGLEISGKLLKDTTKGNGLSQYFQVAIEQ